MVPATCLIKTIVDSNKTHDGVFLHVIFLEKRYLFPIYEKIHRLRCLIKSYEDARHLITEDHDIDRHEVY